MPLEQRAKIFIPFEPLKGFEAAIREKERQLEAQHPQMHAFGEDGDGRELEDEVPDGQEPRGPAPRDPLP